MLAPNTSTTTAANSRPSATGENPKCSRNTRGAAEKTANRLAIRRLEVLAGTKNLESRSRPR
jgi:hypothetical protein